MCVCVCMCVCVTDDSQVHSVHRHRLFAVGARAGLWGPGRVLYNQGGGHLGRTTDQQGVSGLPVVVALVWLLSTCSLCHLDMRDGFTFNPFLAK